MLHLSRVFKIITLSLAIVALPIDAALAGFSISIGEGRHARQYSHAYSGRPASPYYFNRYGQRYLRESPVYFDRYRRRFFHHRHQALRSSICDVIVVRPRYGRPYRVEQNCRRPTPRIHRHDPNSVR